MPVTAMHEYHFAQAREHDVWNSRQIAAVQAVAITKLVNQSPDENLRVRILTTHLRHYLAAFLCGYRVHVADRLTREI